MYICNKHCTSSLVKKWWAGSEKGPLLVCVVEGGGQEAFGPVGPKCPFLARLCAGWWAQVPACSSRVAAVQPLPGASSLCLLWPGTWGERLWSM